jgi:hypothetical protein
MLNSSIPYLVGGAVFILGIVASLFTTGLHLKQQHRSHNSHHGQGPHCGSGLGHHNGSHHH